MTRVKTGEHETHPARLAALDGLRGVAACGVAFLYHPLLELSAPVAASAPAAVLWLRAWAWSCVDLFFVISGYIFAHVYLGTKRLDCAHFGSFWRARFARLYPLHFVMLIVCAFLFGAAQVNTGLAFVAHLFMLQAFVNPEVRHFNGPAWSVSVEMACYALFALGAVRSDKVMRWITAGAIVIPLLYLAVLGRPGGPWFGECFPRGPLGFFIGQLLWRCRDRIARIPAPVLMVMALLGFSLVGVGPASPLFALDLLVWPAVACLALRMAALKRGPLLWLGDRSYAVYMIHFPILLYFLPWLHTASSGGETALIIAGFAAVVLFYADLAYRWFEVPARKAIRGWKTPARRAAVPDVTAV